MSDSIVCCLATRTSGTAFAAVAGCLPLASAARFIGWLLQGYNGDPMDITKPRLGRFRPRCSLRVLMVCFLAITAVVAVYRDPLRRRVETLLSRSEKTVDHLLIVGPQTAGLPVALDPPSPNEIIEAMAKAGVYEDSFVDLQMILEPVADYVDPPQFSSLTGLWQLHHAQYKCTIYCASGQRTVYIDHNHRCVPDPLPGRRQ